MMAQSSVPVLLQGILIFVMLVTALTQDVEDCESKEVCGECIQTPSCQWCSQLSTSDKGKCFRADADLSGKCANTTSVYVENPINNLTIIEDLDLTVANIEVNISQKLVQLKPQKVKLKLRRGVPHNITVKFRQAQDYPVDLYYLMDLSNSMKEDKKTVATLGSKIADTLRKHTKQVRLGFGSFVDKVLLPYVDMSPAKLKSPCPNCTRPFSFRNNLPLNRDTDEFKTKVNEIQMSGNMDSPEGGFDALMQVMKCTEQIDWSDNARRIIVFSTDAKFHSAGDGRLAGIIERNDEQCHLNDKGEYTHYAKVDYPSIAQINKVAKEERVNIIFAVSNYEKLYELLKNEIESSAYGKLSGDSDNVVQLVEDQYLAISSKVELKHNTEDMDGALLIEYFARCPGDPENSFNKSNTCLKLQEGDEIEFKLQITLQKCPDESNFTINVGTTEEKLEIEVETLCDCNCQEDGHDLKKKWSSVCNYVGTLMCGVCECDPDYNGENCQCQKGKSETSSNEDKSACKKDGDQHEEECSGNGFCDCGQCKCEDDFAGQLCQCDRRACYTLNSNVPCSGRGDCNCNECNCNHGFIGDMCECPVDSVCIAPGESEICSGAGECDCGECKCKEDGTSGRFCEDCPTCGTGKCQLYKDCVQWKGFTSGEIEDKRHFEQNCSHIKRNMKMVDSLDSETENGATLCTYNDAEDDCIFYFTYHFRNLGTGRDYQISIQRIRTCPEPPNLLAIVLSVVASIVAIGLLTLLVWKVVTTLHDKKEFDRFEEDRKKAEWTTGENPLYKEVTQTIQNPNYRP